MNNNLRPRYAIYFTPTPASDWDRFGAEWLGHEPHTAARTPDGVPAELFATLTRRPRRYRFHATLKAPFRLAAGFTERELLHEVEALARERMPLRLSLRPHWLDDFLALTPVEPSARLSALGAACVTRLDHLRAPPDEAELARRLRAPLSARERELLARWGYPQVLDAWRFHMTLTDPINPDDTRLRAALEAEAQARLPVEAPTLDALSVLIECKPDEPLSHVARIPLTACARLIYVVGPSGAGKDTLLAWVRQRISPQLPIVFARRTIARPPGFSGSDIEGARLVDAALFSRLSAEGAFALEWHAHGSSYGIDRGIVEQLAAGTSIVVNGSREFLPVALRRFPNIEVIHVTAPESVLRQRLAARAREPSQELQARVERRPSLSLPSDVPLVEIANDGPVEVAGKRLQNALLCA